MINQEKVLARYKRYEKKKKRWKQPKRKAYSKKWAKEHFLRRSENKRKYKYGITPEEFKLRLKNQNNRCAICGRKETAIDARTGKIQFLSVDHDHVTNKIRELLCGNCNRGLGMFLDDMSTLAKAIQYLEKHKELNASTTFNG